MTAPTKEQVIEWAREAGMSEAQSSSPVSVALLTKFASLVATAEREACAKTCEDYADSTSDYDVHRRVSAYWCADLIRKRGGNENIN